MKRITLSCILLLLIIFQSCIDNDIIDDTIQEKLTFNNSLIELTIKSTHQYDTKYIDNAGNIQNPTIIWKSSDSNTISVSNTGLITALSLGQATITASITLTDKETILTKETITVKEAEEELVINNPIEDLTINLTHQYTSTYTNNLADTENKQITWVSSNSSIISVSNSGLITALTLGTATITASTTTSQGKTVLIEDTLTVKDSSERLSLNNPIVDLKIGNTHQYTTTYTNSNGQIETKQVTWESSKPSIISVSDSGLITSLTSGEAIITASITNSSGQTLEVQDFVLVMNNNVTEKSGVIVTTSNYVLQGDFTLKEIPNTNNLELTVASNYQASSNLPGLYLYFTNNKNSIGSAKEIAKVLVFNGTHKYIIENVGINDFSHLLYWCKPFSVKVGVGEIK